MPNVAAFFEAVREHLGNLNQSQVDGFNTLIEKWAESKLTDLRWFAYMLATAWHETARTMQPIHELGSTAYLESKAYWPYYGRGYVQLTWKVNYERYNIASTPQKAMEPATAAHIMIDGMEHGIFTGKRLSDYFNAKTDAVNARRIINGTDQAVTIAGYYAVFHAALEAMEAPPIKVA